MTRPVRIAVTTIALAASALGLVACGGKSGSSSTSTTSTAAAPGSTSSSNARGAGRFGQIYRDPEVRACLKAAGITVPTGGSRPSGSFTRARPSDFPSGERPSDFPSGQRPSDFPSGARPTGAGGGFGNSAEAEKIQAALKACGITLPTRTGQPTAGATASGAPAS
jgi:hypothetical protein